MWFDLAWFGQEFREGTVELVTTEVVSANRFVQQGRGFDYTDVDAMVEEQFKIISDQATLDQPGAVHPERFSAPDDAETHVRLAREAYERLFGCAPRGMWPAEGAVSQDVVPLFADHGAREEGRR